jgi:protein-S-isoprenylcysteine O-methyltransferase Ste14
MIRRMGTAESEQGGARVRFPPPLVYLGFVLLGVALRYLRPLALDVDRGVLIAVGAAAALAGIALVLSARLWFSRTGQDPRPWRPSPELILRGPYRFTRNPMYLGIFLFQLGIGVALDNLWIVLLAPASLLVVHFIAVRPEEAHLEQKFGEPYRRFKASVRRYL